MDKKLEILIVEDDMDICDDFKDLIMKSDDLFLIGTTGYVNKALELTDTYHPDVIILDLELQFTGGSGLDVLNGITKLKLSKKPFILITTNNSSQITFDIARHLGADYIMSKHQTGYCSTYVLDFLRMIKTSIQHQSNILSIKETTEETQEQYKSRLTLRITEELYKVGINPRYKGYQYLTDAILIMINNPTSNICNAVGKLHGKTDSSIERAMQNAINKAWRTSDINDLLKYYTAIINSDRGNPTITEFVCYYANKLKNEY